MKACSLRVLLLAVVVLMLNRQIKALYRDHHFVIECKDVLSESYVYLVTLKNVTKKINKTQQRLLKLHTKFTNHEWDMDTNCDPVDREKNTTHTSTTTTTKTNNPTPEPVFTRQWKCIFRPKGTSIHRIGKMRVVNSTGHTLFATNKTFFLNQENYRCHQQHGFKSFTLISENFNSVSVSYEIYEDDVQWFLDKDHPLKIMYHPVHSPLDFKSRRLSAVMTGTNKEIITDLAPCTKYTIYIQLELISYINGVEGDRANISVNTLCDVKNVIKVKQKDYAMLYAFVALLATCVIVIAVFFRRKFGQKFSCCRSNNKQNEFQSNNRDPKPPPLPRRPKHLQTRKERFMTFLLNLNLPTLKQKNRGNVKNDGTEIIDQNLIFKQFPKHFYASITNISAETSHKEDNFTKLLFTGFTEMTSSDVEQQHNTGMETSKETVSDVSSGIIYDSESFHVRHHSSGSYYSGTSCSNKDTSEEYSSYTDDDETVDP